MFGVAMNAAVPWLQALAGVLWAMEAIVLAPGSWRSLRGRGDALDAGRIPVLLIALLQVGFSARWYLWPHALGVMLGGELAFWATLYVLSSSCALYCIAAHRVVGRSLR